LKPVEALIETSVGDKETKAYWPKELREISDRLYKSFESRDQAVFSQIARGVIHDLRTLIHTPLGAIDLVDEQSPGSEKRLARLEHLQSVSKSQIPKMKEIIDTTLDGSREIGISPKYAPTRLAVDGAIRTLDNLIKQSRTEIKVRDEVGPRTLQHDPTQLERAITNLIKNGIEACQEQAKASKITPCIQVSLRTEAESVEISIEDNGPGLPTSSPRVFRPLKSTKTHGSGLGLVVSRKIIEAHGGELVPGRSVDLGGARFTIRLPNGRIQ
jgi:two-component system, NtrC family, sensor histidine kinase HydH